MSRFDAPIEANFTFVDTAEPPEPEEGDTWYNPDTDEAAVWDSNSWQQMNVTQHGSLSGVSEGDHRSDQRVGELAPVQSVNGSTGDVTGLATDSGLSSHESDETNPHNVTDDQTGAAAALSNHEADADRHHSRPTSTDDYTPGYIEYTVFEKQVNQDGEKSNTLGAAEAHEVLVNTGASTDWYVRLYDMTGLEYTFSDYEFNSGVWVTPSPLPAPISEVAVGSLEGDATMEVKFRKRTAESHSHNV